MKFIQHYEVVLEEAYTLEFVIKGQEYTFAFPCNKRGKVDKKLLPSIGRTNLENCLNGTLEVLSSTIIDCSHEETYYSIVQCPCGREIALTEARNYCNCGLSCDMYGQEL